MGSYSRRLRDSAPRPRSCRRAPARDQKEKAVFAVNRRQGVKRYPQEERQECPVSREMKVIVERSGGFAGIIRRGEKDLSALSPEQQTALQKLLDKGAPPALTQMGADRFTYKIEVQDEHGSRSWTL